MTNSTPYISFVVTSRNDNHGGGLLLRMQTFVNCLMDQCRRRDLRAELIIVEWNPPSDQLPLADALSWPGTAHCPVRIVQVSPELHRRFEYSDRLPLFQMIAKNVGIRRARAPFVLATNIDILFSEELITYLALRRLDERMMYRTDRHDIPAALPTDLPVDRLLEFCRRNSLRIYKPKGVVDAKTGIYDEGSITWKTRIHDIYMVLSRKGVEKRLHTHACGDFTLMAKSHWFRIRGYPELPMLSMNVDSLGYQNAYFAGARERVLKSPMQVYHMEHSTAGWTPEGDGALVAANSNGIPHLDYMQYRTFAVRMRKERQPIEFNDKKWGLADEVLPEVMRG